MKKIIKYFICLFIILFSCSCNKSNTRFMLKGDYSISSVKEIENYELENKISNNESFVLCVLLSTCTTCEQFKNDVLNKYIINTHSVIYSIDLTFLENYKNYENKPYVKVAPSIIIYNEGKIISTLSYKYENKEFKELESFKNYMDKYIIEPRLINILQEDLDSKILNNESFVLYIGWYKCGDCQLLESRLLNKYLLDNYNENVIYYLESDEYRSSKPKKKPVIEDYQTIEEYNEALNNWNNWISFATKYNFVEYNYGKIPTLQYYENGIKKDMIVYHNDKIENDVVIDSFFKECVGKNMNEEQLLKYHDDKTIEFLNKYYKGI